MSTSALDIGQSNATQSQGLSPFDAKAAEEEIRDIVA